MPTVYMDDGSTASSLSWGGGQVTRAIRLYRDISTPVYPKGMSCGMSSKGADRVSHLMDRWLMVADSGDSATSVPAYS